MHKESSSSSSGGGFGGMRGMRNTRSRPRDQGVIPEFADLRREARESRSRNTCKKFSECNTKRTADFRPADNDETTVTLLSADDGTLTISVPTLSIEVDIVETSSTSGGLSGTYPLDCKSPGGELLRCWAANHLSVHNYNSERSDDGERAPYKGRYSVLVGLSEEEEREITAGTKSDRILVKSRKQIANTTTTNYQPKVHPGLTAHVKPKNVRAKQINRPESAESADERADRQLSQIRNRAAMRQRIVSKVWKHDKPLMYAVGTLCDYNRFSSELAYQLRCDFITLALNDNRVHVNDPFFWALVWAFDADEADVASVLDLVKLDKDWIEFGVALFGLEDMDVDDGGYSGWLARSRNQTMHALNGNSVTVHQCSVVGNAGPTWNALAIPIIQTASNYVTDYTIRFRVQNFSPPAGQYLRGVVMTSAAPLLPQTHLENPDWYYDGANGYTNTYTAPAQEEAHFLDTFGTWSTNPCELVTEVADVVRTSTMTEWLYVGLWIRSRGASPGSALVTVEVSQRLNPVFQPYDITALNKFDVDLYIAPILNEFANSDQLTYVVPVTAPSGTTQLENVEVRAQNVPRSATQEALSWLTGLAAEYVDSQLGIDLFKRVAGNEGYRALTMGFCPKDLSLTAIRSQNPGLSGPIITNNGVVLVSVSYDDVLKIPAVAYSHNYNWFVSAIESSWVKRAVVFVVSALVVDWGTYFQLKHNKLMHILNGNIDAITLRDAIPEATRPVALGPETRVIASDGRIRVQQLLARKRLRVIGKKRVTQRYSKENGTLMRALWVLDHGDGDSGWLLYLSRTRNKRQHSLNGNTTNICTPEEFVVRSGTNSPQVLLDRFVGYNSTQVRSAIDESFHKTNIPIWRADNVQGTQGRFPCATQVWANASSCNPTILHPDVPFPFLTGNWANLVEVETRPMENSGNLAFSESFDKMVAEWRSGAAMFARPSALNPQLFNQVDVLSSQAAAKICNPTLETIYLKHHLFCQYLTCTDPTITRWYGELANLGYVRDEGNEQVGLSSQISRVTPTTQGPITRNTNSAAAFDDNWGWTDDPAGNQGGNPNPPFLENEDFEFTVTLDIDAVPEGWDAYYIPTELLTRQDVSKVIAWLLIILSPWPAVPLLGLTEIDLDTTGNQERLALLHNSCMVRIAGSRKIAFIVSRQNENLPRLTGGQPASWDEYYAFEQGITFGEAINGINARASINFLDPLTLANANYQNDTAVFLGSHLASMSARACAMYHDLLAAKWPEPGVSDAAALTAIYLTNRIPVSFNRTFADYHGVAVNEDTNILGLGGNAFNKLCRKLTLDGRYSTSGHIDINGHFEQAASIYYTYNMTPSLWNAMILAAYAVPSPKTTTNILSKWNGYYQTKGGEGYIGIVALSLLRSFSSAFYLLGAGVGLLNELLDAQQSQYWLGVSDQMREMYAIKAGEPARIDYFDSVFSHVAGLEPYVWTVNGKTEKVLSRILLNDQLPWTPTQSWAGNAINGNIQDDDVPLPVLTPHWLHYCFGTSVMKPLAMPPKVSRNHYGAFGYQGHDIRAMRSTTGQICVFLPTSNDFAPGTLLDVNSISYYTEIDMWNRMFAAYLRYYNLLPGSIVQMSVGAQTNTDDYVLMSDDSNNLSPVVTWPGYYRTFVSTDVTDVIYQSFQFLPIAVQAADPLALKTRATIQVASDFVEGGRAIVAVPMVLPQLQAAVSTRVSGGVKSSAPAWMRTRDSGSALNSGAAGSGQTPAAQNQ